jgi:hypothetical protein
VKWFWCKTCAVTNDQVTTLKLGSAESKFPTETDRNASWAVSAYPAPVTGFFDQTSADRPEMLTRKRASKEQGSSRAIQVDPDTRQQSTQLENDKAKRKGTATRKESFSSVVVS